MIRSGLIPGLVFGAESDGDGRRDANVRQSWSDELGISDGWATINQVHGADVLVANAPGPHGQGDGLVTDVPGLPLAVATADCVPVGLAGASSVAIVHAGWRGVAAGVVPEAISVMRSLGDQPQAAVIGPHIGSCCYEVGPEVIEQIGGFAGTTRAGTTSADLYGALRAQLTGLEIEAFGMCTMDDVAFASHRRNATPNRQIAVIWRT